MRTRKIKTILFVLFCGTLLFLGIAYSVLKQPVKIIGKANLVLKEDQGDYIVTYEIKNQWYSNGKYVYEISMKLLNNTEKVLDGWNISVRAPIEAQIVNFSNVSCTLKENRIEFQNLSYNAQVPAKSSVEFEFQVSTTDPYYEPKDIIINGSNVLPPQPPEEPEESEKEVQIEIKEDNGWSAGEYQFYQYTVTITNTGKQTINGWSFDLKLQNESSIDQIWNANIEKQDNQITISNSGYNGIITAGGEVNFGFILKTKEKQNLQPINIILK